MTEVVTNDSAKKWIYAYGFQNLSDRYRKSSRNGVFWFW